MRGTIILWSGDKGVVSADGQRYDFDINHWTGNTAPTAGLTVDLAITGGRLTAITAVDEADLAKEKLVALSGQGSKIARAVYEDVGKDVAVGYGVFLFVALFSSVVSVQGADVSISLADLLSGNMGLAALLGGGSGKGTILVLIGAASIAVPYVWKHKYAPLAFCLPLLITAFGFWHVYKQYSETRKQMEAMGEFGRMYDQMAQEMSTGISMGVGAWILIAAGAYLAFKGVMRFLSRS
jgi:hypothetical protein